jgi:hypothetical protein
MLSSGVRLYCMAGDIDAALLVPVAEALDLGRARLPQVA